MNRYLHTVYCDDVREERGNKLSLIGTYGSDLFVREFPAVLPRLSFFITLVTPTSNALKSLTILIKRDEQVIVEVTIPPGDFEKHNSALRVAEANAPQSNEDSIRLTTLRTVFHLSPFAIAAPCILRVLARTESDELRCPALRIGLEPERLATAEFVDQIRMETEFPEHIDLQQSGVEGRN